jgi:hypothetical protein
MRKAMQTLRIRRFGSRRLVAAGVAGALLASVAAIAATVMLSVAPAAGAGGGCFSSTSVPVCTFKNLTAFAHFGLVSDDKCTFTDTFVQPVQALTSPGRGESTFVFISISELNMCQNTDVQVANFDPVTFMPVFNGTAQIDSKLGSASVVGTAPMFDFNGNLIYTATVNVSWLGIGPIDSMIDNNHFRSAGFMVNEHFNGQSREAMASGTLTDPAGANVAATPTTEADMENATGGSIFLSH